MATDRELLLELMAIRFPDDSAARAALNRCLAQACELVGEEAVCSMIHETPSPRMQRERIISLIEDHLERPA